MQQVSLVDCSEVVLGKEHLPSWANGWLTDEGSNLNARDMTLSQAEARYIQVRPRAFWLQLKFHCYNVEWHIQNTFFPLLCAWSMSFFSSSAYNWPAVSGSLYLPRYTSGRGAYMCTHTCMHLAKATHAGSPYVYVHKGQEHKWPYSTYHTAHQDCMFPAPLHISFPLVAANVHQRLDKTIIPSATRHRDRARMEISGTSYHCLLLLCFHSLVHCNHFSASRHFLGYPQCYVIGFWSTPNQNTLEWEYMNTFA